MNSGENSQEKGNKLYVGNIPFDLAETELAEVFHQFGQVQRTLIVTDRENGSSRGFGFVTMSTKAQAEDAIRASKATGVKIGNRNLAIQRAKPKTT